VAPFADFFHYLDGNYGKELPTYNGNGGGYWEDGMVRDAHFAAEDRPKQPWSASAEILSTVTYSMDQNLMNPPKGLLPDIWRNSAIRFPDAAITKAELSSGVQEAPTTVRVLGEAVYLSFRPLEALQPLRVR
jgi:hypothetical protein